MDDLKDNKTELQSLQNGFELTNSIKVCFGEYIAFVAG